MSEPLATLASPRRREILRLVWNREQSASDIHRALDDVTFGAISQHLRTLMAAGLVEMRRSGRWRLYRARREQLGPVAETLESLWDDALYRLKLEAELEAARRGPRPQPQRKPNRRRARASGAN